MTQQWPHTAAAVSFARSFTILSTVVRFICDISWHVGSAQRLTMNVFAVASLTLSCRCPLHPTRQRERGFNQAGLLAELLSSADIDSVQAVLKRIRYTTTQTAFDRIDRMENLRNAFRLRKRIDVRGLHVLLVDDVLTTGSTLSECARVLREAGALSVYAVTAARA